MVQKEPYTVTRTNRAGHYYHLLLGNDSPEQGRKSGMVLSCKQPLLTNKIVVHPDDFYLLRSG